MRRLFWLGAVVGLGAWVIVLQRKLNAATMRGDMYRDISARLDRRIAELTSQER